VVSDQHASLLADLKAALGEASLLRDPAECLAYGYDNSRRQAQPLAVALPTTREQVQAIVRACRQHRVPLVARGRGTNTTGASVPVHGGVVVSFERMNRLLDIRPGDRAAVVEPGLLNGELQTALKAQGLSWPPDPTSAPYSSIGGNLACNAGGPRALKYGASRDNVLALVAVDGRGELIRFGAATTKASMGFDLSRLLVGSEGTLALIVEATLRLVPLAPARASLRALYADAPAAARAVSRIMAQAVTPSMLEFMDADCVRLAREVGSADLPEAGALLMIEADGTPAEIEHALAALRAAAEGEGCLDIAAAREPAQTEKLWAARKALSPALRTIAAGKINEDVVVPVSRIADLVEAVRAIAARHTLRIVCFGHAGNGNLHVNLLFDPQDPGIGARTEAALDELFATTLSLGGLLSGEHGIGLSKRAYMERALEPSTLATMRAIKQVFDPDGILNPGKLLP
jgi:D-lactate dehydrogenase